MPQVCACVTVCVEYRLISFSASSEMVGSSGENMRCCFQFMILRYVSGEEREREGGGKEGGKEGGREGGNKGDYYCQSLAVCMFSVSYTLRFLGAERRKSYNRRTKQVT